MASIPEWKLLSRAAARIVDLAKPVSSVTFVFAVTSAEGRELAAGFPASREISRDFFWFPLRIPDLCPNSAIFLSGQGISRELAGNFQI
jgi:hypothetical protein